MDDPERTITPRDVPRRKPRRVHAINLGECFVGEIAEVDDGLMAIHVIMIEEVDRRTGTRVVREVVKRHGRLVELETFELAAGTKIRKMIRELRGPR